MPAQIFTFKDLATLLLRIGASAVCDCFFLEFGIVKGLLTDENQ